jgi:hypothetical protein
MCVAICCRNWKQRQSAPDIHPAPSLPPRSTPRYPRPTATTSASATDQNPYLDLVVFAKDGACIAVIETKVSETQTMGSWVPSKYGGLYAAFGVPLYLIGGMEDVDRFTETHLPHLSNDYDLIYKTMGDGDTSKFQKFIEARKNRRCELKLRKLHM